VWPARAGRARHCLRERTSVAGRRAHGRAWQPASERAGGAAERGGRGAAGASGRARRSASVQDSVVAGERHGRPRARVRR
jgi:hypothetical protein